VISKYRGQSPIRAESLCKFLPFPDDLILVFIDKFGQSHNLTRHISSWPRRAGLVRASAKGATHGPQERARIAGALPDGKNYLFASCDAGGRRAAAIYSLIESAKLKCLNPQHYLADVLACIADHPARRIAELFPWNWQPVDTTRAAA
jgi:transposase